MLTFLTLKFLINNARVETPQFFLAESPSKLPWRPKMKVTEAENDLSNLQITIAAASVRTGREHLVVHTHRPFSNPIWRFSVRLWVISIVL